MALDADALVERRSLRRRLTTWRAAALALAAIAAFAVGWRTVAPMFTRGGAHVARVALSGIIVGGDERRKMFEQLARSPARAVVLVINSPGGGVAASEQLYRQLRSLAAQKPVVALVDSVGASGGYMAALGADHIVARQTALTGSIGVLAQFPNFSELLGKVGVKVEEVKSAPLKAAPNGFEPTSPEARAALQAVVMDTFAWFKGLVGERRNLSGAELDDVSNGRIFTGSQAKAAGLVDEIGGEEEARAWLAREKGISVDLPIRDWKPRSGVLEGFFSKAAVGLLDGMGLSSLAGALRQSTASAPVLDGLVAVWQPSTRD